MKKILMLVVVFCIYGATEVNGQLRPLTDHFMRGFRDGESDQVTYVHKRCAAIFVTIASAMSEAGVNVEDAVNVYKMKTILFTMAAAELDPLYESDEARASERTGAAVKEISDIYINRMNRNLAISGQLYDEDAMIQNDLTLCNTLFDRMSGN